MEATTINFNEITAYIINLDESRKRWIDAFRSISNFIPAGRIQRVAAINGRNFAEPRTKDGWNQKKLSQFQRQGLIGESQYPDPVRSALCFSHQRAIMKFLNDISGIRQTNAWALILEDDALSADALTSAPCWPICLSVPNDAELIFLHDRVQVDALISSGSALNIDFVDINWHHVKGGIGLEGYLINPAGAKKLLQLWKPLFIECDIQLMAMGISNSNNVDLNEKLINWRADSVMSHTSADKIKCYAPNRPLIQINDKLPSVKFTILEDLHHVSPRASVASNLEFNFRSPMAFATCWFNPMHYRSRLENFIRFSTQKNLPNLLTVELAFGDDDWQLPDDTPNLVRLRTNTVCWQKEALLNHGLSILDEKDFAFLGWLDADVIFKNDDWQERLIDVAMEKRLCQVFERAHTAFPDKGMQVTTGAAASWLDHGLHPTDCRVTGFGWLMQKDVWRYARLYDWSLIGGGDHVMWRALFMEGLGETRLFDNSPYPKSFKQIRQEWAERWCRSINLSLGYPKGTSVMSLPHGREADRQYFSRANVLRKLDFNPDKHLQRDPNGLLQWRKSASSDIKNALKEYFSSRREDAVH